MVDESKDRPDQEELPSDRRHRQILDDILEDTANTMPVLPEPIFVKHFLPLFASEEEVDLTPWLDVAGNAQNPVRVINREGEVLFTVPPLLRDVPFRGERGEGDGNPINEVIEDALNQGRMSPVLGNRLVRSALEERLVRIPTDLNVLEQWNEIFRRYNYPEITVPQDVRDAWEEAKALSTGGSPSADNDLDTDEFEEL